MMSIMRPIYLSLILISIGLSGCATSRLYSGSALPAEQVAILERGDLAQILKSVDDQNSVNFFLSNSAVEILPGKHTIAVGYGDGSKRGYPYTLTFTAKPGVQYVIKSDFINSQWKPSIVEKKTQIKVDEYPINLIPMYGFPEIQKTESQKIADEQFIKTVVAESGSRKKSSTEFVAWGWSERQKGNVDSAMRRFNQAWLLNPNNYLAYWGFGAISLAKEKPSEAAIYFERALNLIDDESQKSRLFVDAARAYALRANLEKQTTQKKSDESYNKAKMLIMKALRIDQKYEKAYRIGALISYDYGDYERAWEIVNKARATGNYRFDNEFIKALSTKMVEPN